MSRLICVTNRTLCRGDYLGQIRKIAAASPKAIILREKDLPAEEYRLLAEQVLEICRIYHTPCILHTFTEIAIQLRADALHLPLPLLQNLSEAQKAHFIHLGASCHSMQDAKEAESLGCTYITAGHIFATDCKKGVPPRGLPFLKDICQSVHIPVYAIGGIDGSNWKSAIHAGAAGVCIMGKAMKSENPAACFKNFT